MWDHQSGNCFVTLTYDDEHIPHNWTLNKRDFQLFMKRLRKTYSHKTIRYFHVGEYGDRCPHTTYGEEPLCGGCNVGRPHYHAILFNHDFRDRELFGERNGVPHYTSAELTEIWGNGFTQVGDVTPESAGYVARYALKKVTGAQS